MDRKPKINLTRRVTIRLKPEEYSKIHSKFKSTTKRKLSEYIRAVLLEKPLTVFTRSKSLDDFISEMILLRSELNSIGNNFNQSVKRLHTLDKIPDIKTWAILNEKSKEILIKKVDEIKEKINQFSYKWLQE
jgi:hypothetical protein